MTTGREQSGWLQKLGRALPTVLITAGLLLGLTALGLKWYAAEQQRQMVAAYAAAQARAAAAQAASDQTALTELPDPDALLAEADADQSDGDDQDQGVRGPAVPIALMTIPKIDLTVTVGEGVDPATLRYAVGHFEQTALPGEAGNFSVIGHRNYTFGQYFNRLDEMAPGDEVAVEYDGQIFTYTVTDTFVVNPEDVWVLDETDASEITLITCTPIRIATHRLIVKGELTDVADSNL